MHDPAWLESLAVGDEVVLSGGWAPQISKVSGVTPTQVRIGSMRFRKKDGRLIGASGFRSQWLHRPTDEMRARIARTNAVSKLATMSRQQWESLSDEALGSILALLPG